MANLVSQCWTPFVWQIVLKFCMDIKSGDNAIFWWFRETYEDHGGGAESRQWLQQRNSGSKCWVMIKVWNLITVSCKCDDDHGEGDGS